MMRSLNITTKILNKNHLKINFYVDFYYSLAPSIYENIDIKKGILLQLFGGTAKDFTAAGRGKFRSILLIILF